MEVGWGGALWARKGWLMKLVDLTEPFFQYCCRLNRSARKGTPPPEDVVRVEFGQQFEKMRLKSSQMGGTTAADYQRIEPALILFADALIRESALPFAATWQAMALDHPGLESDQVFFDLADAALSDQSPSSTEVLAVLFTCLGLGFSGGQRPETLRSKMTEMSARLRSVMDTENEPRICPEAYENVDQTNYVEPPARIVGGVLIALVGLAVVLLGANIFLFMSSSKALEKTLNDIRSIDD